MKSLKKLGALPELNFLDLSENHFSRKIPLQLQNLKLNVLNFSYNNLLGKLPSFYKKDIYKDSFLSNPAPSQDTDPKRRSFAWITGYIFALSGMVSFVRVVCSVSKLWNLSKGILMLKWRSFHKLASTNTSTWIALRKTMPLAVELLVESTRLRLATAKQFQ